MCEAEGKLILDNFVRDGRVTKSLTGKSSQGRIISL